jgi:glycosyltransferase involved in cell wall biosynthesis
MKLSILMPIYNEIRTIESIVDLVARALPDVEKELVMVDDGSKDGTREWLANTFPSVARDNEPGATRAATAQPFRPGLAAQVVFHERNMGKGAAVQTAMKACTGDVVVIQDADLEYDPADWKEMYDLIVGKRIADVVYGSRFHGRPHRSMKLGHYLANRLISATFSILFNQTLSDIETCYKMFTREVLKTLNISSNDFGIEVQISAQIALHRRWRIYEMGIHYYGRTSEEGKKINWKDGFKALLYVFQFRFAPGN